MPTTIPMKKNASSGTFEPLPREQQKSINATASGIFSGSSEDLTGALKKSSTLAAQQSAADRAQFMDVLGTNEDDQRTSERDLALAGGQFRGMADANANQQVANISARAGGDTSSPLFQMLATGARGGAAASTGAAMARFRLEDAQSQKSRALDRARLLLGLRQTEQQGQQLQLQQAGFMRGIFESDRTAETQQSQFDDQLRLNALTGAWAAGNSPKMLEGGANAYNYATGGGSGFSNATTAAAILRNKSAIF